MFRKKLRESLSARIFLLTLVILLAASGTTFGLIAWATPITYVSVISDALDAQAKTLVGELDQHSDYDTMMSLAADFAARTGAAVTILSPEGDVLTLSSFGTVAAVEAESQPAGEAETMAGTADVSVTTTDAGIIATAAISAAEGNGGIVEDTSVAYGVAQETVYSFTVSDREGSYTLSVAPSTQPVNQAVQALARVAPWLLCCMLLFSLLCAFGYSRYISRPILRLSNVSQRMAALDFSWAYEGNRLDEIGTLGRNLNSLSGSLASALGELRQANAALQRDIALERELEQQRLAFFSAASHELKTPVTILKGQLTGMLEGVDVYQDRDKYLARSLQVTGRMEHLVQELLTISRMEAADFSAQQQPLDLAQLLREQLPLYAELAEQKGLAVETGIPEALPLTGDEALLRKALDSVLSNAMLYSPAGEAVQVTAERAALETVLTVENSGVQLPQEALPRLFDAFYRVEQSRSRSTGGSGLGLYLTARILQRHSAAYAIENTAAGVRFTIRFPGAEGSTENT